MTKFLSTTAICGLPSLSWTSHASMIVLNSQVDFWIIYQCCMCNCVMYSHIRWSRGRIPFRVSLSVKWSTLLGVQPDCLIWDFCCWYRHIFVSPQPSAELFWQRVLDWWWCLLIARWRVPTNIHNRPVILSDHRSKSFCWRWCIFHEYLMESGYATTIYTVHWHWQMLLTSWHFSTLSSLREGPAFCNALLTCLGNIPRKCLNFLTLLGGLSTSIACTLTIGVYLLFNIQPRY